MPVLKSRDPALMVEQAKAYLCAMPDGSVVAIEVGNEPDICARHSGRPKGYGFSP